MYKLSKLMSFFNECLQMALLNSKLNSLMEPEADLRIGPETELLAPAASCWPVISASLSKEAARPVVAKATKRRGRVSFPHSIPEVAARLLPCHC